jgi:hypothetical protein
MPDSPASLVGLRKYDDFIIGSEKVTFQSTTERVVVAVVAVAVVGVVVVVATVAAAATTLPC